MSEISDDVRGLKRKANDAQGGTQDKIHNVPIIYERGSP